MPTRAVPTADDFLAAILAQMSGQPNFNALFPQKVWPDERPGNQTGPGTYAVMTVEVGDQGDIDSAGSYIQKATCEVTAWVSVTQQQAAAGEAPQTEPVAQFLDTCFNWLSTNPSNDVAVPNAVQTMWCHPISGKLKLNPQLRRSKDVFLSGKRFEIVVQGQN